MSTKKVAKKSAVKKYDKPVDMRKIKHSDSAKIANKTGYSQSHTCNVLAGRRFNNDIIREAKKMTAKRK